MKLTTACVAATAACIALSGHPLSSTHGASASEELKRAAGYIVSAEQELAGLKASVLASFKSLQYRVIDADEQSDKWVQLGKLEGDARMKAINYGFRDAFRSHAKHLTEIVEQLRDLGRIGERLESNVKLLRVLQANLEQIARGQLALGKARSLLASTKQGLDILQQDVFLSVAMAKNNHRGLSAQASSVLEHDKKVRQLLAGLGNPQDRIKDWEKQLIETELDNNTTEAKELATVSSLGARIASVLTTIGNATKTLQLVAIGL